MTLNPHTLTVYGTYVHALEKGRDDSREGASTLSDPTERFMCRLRASVLDDALNVFKKHHGVDDSVVFDADLLREMSRVALEALGSWDDEDGAGIMAPIWQEYDDVGGQIVTPILLCRMACLVMDTIASHEYDTTEDGLAISRDIVGEWLSKIPSLKKVKL